MYQTTVLNESRKMHRDVAENCAKTLHTKKRCNNNQIKALMEYMSHRPEFAEGFSSDIPKYDEERKCLARSLNMLGSKKTIAAWQVTWRDLRRRHFILRASPDEEDWSMEPTNTKTLPQPIFFATGSISDCESELNSINRSWSENEKLSRKKRCNKMQLRSLIKYMSSHPDLARNEFSRSPVGIRRKAKEWDKLAAHLNKLGTEKSVKQWKTTWRDVVRRSLKEARKLKYKAMAAEEVPYLIKSSDEDDRSIETSMPDTISGIIKRSLDKECKAAQQILDIRQIDRERKRVSVWMKKIRAQKVLDIVKSTDDDEISEDNQESGEDMPESVEDFKESGEFIQESGENIHESRKDIQESGKAISENGEDIQNFTRVESDEHPCPMEDMSIFFERSLSPQSRLNSPDLENVEKPIDCDDIELESQESPGQSDSGQMSPLRYDSDLNSDGESTERNFDFDKVSTEKSSSSRVLSKQISNAVKSKHTAARDINQTSSMSSNNELKSDDFLRKTNRNMVTPAGSTRAQTAALVDYMSQHIALAAAKHTGFDTFDPRYAEWRQVTKYLNKMGPAKSTLFWKITWQKLIVQSTRAKQDSGFDGIYRKVRDILGKIPSEDNSPKTVPIEEISAQKHSVRQEMPVRCYAGQPSNSEQMSPVLSELNIITELDALQVEKKTPTKESDDGLKSLNTGGSHPRYQNRRCYTAQKVALVNFIKSRPHMAYPPHKSSATCEEWRCLSDRLNKIGPPKNSVRAWQITWQGMKRVALKAKKNRPKNELSECVKKTLEVIEAYRRSHTTSRNREIEHDIESSQRFRETGESFGNARCSKAQIAALVDYMTDNSAVATSKHKGPCSEDPNIEGWRQLSKDLNRMGVARSITGWKQIWRDVVTSVRKSEQSTEWDEIISLKVLKVLGDEVIYRNNSELKIEIVEESGEMPPEFSQMSPDDTGRDTSVNFNLISPVGTGHTSPDNLDEISPVRNCGSESSVRSAQDRDFDTSTVDNDNEDNNKHKRLLRVSRAQLKALVNYISNHRHMATSEQKGPVAMQKRNTEWRRLGRLLNSIGKAKTTDAWKHTWRDLKLRAFTAKLNNSNSFSRQIYQQILSILSLKNGRMESNAKTVEDQMSPVHEFNMSPVHSPSQLSPKDTSREPLNVDQMSAHSTRYASPSNLDQMSPLNNNGSSVRFDQTRAFDALTVDDVFEDDYKKKKRTNNSVSKAQVKALVNYMSSHPSLANIDQKGSNIAIERRNFEWRRLSEILNKIGTIKTVDAWKQIWRDLQRSAGTYKSKKSSTVTSDVYQQILRIMSLKDRMESNTEAIERNTHLKPRTSDNTAISFEQSPSPEPCLNTPDLQCDSEHFSDIQEENNRKDNEQMFKNNSAQSNNVSRHNNSGKYREKMLPVGQSHVFRLHDSGESSQHISSSRCSSNNVTARHNDPGKDQEIYSMSRDFDRNNVPTRLQDSGKHSQQTSSIALRDQFNKVRPKTQRQLNALVDYMYAERKHRNPSHSKWTLITEVLNKMGPITCTDGFYWKQKWLDLKQDVARGSKHGIAGCLDNARMEKVVELVTKYPITERADSPSSAEIAEDTSNIQRKVAEVLSRSTLDCGSIKDKNIEKIGSSNVDSRTAGGDTIERSKEDEESSATATSISNGDTNSLLKELIGELKRSNELKLEQNGLLKQLVNKFSADVPKSSHCSKTYKQTDSYTAPVQKREVEDLTEEYCTNTRNTERSEEHCDAYIQDRTSHINNTVNVERSFPRVTATTPQKTGIPVISKVGTTSSSKKEIRTVDISHLMEPSLFKPPERVVKLKNTVKVPKVNLLRLTDGTMVVMPGTKLPASNDEYQTFIVGSVKHAADSETVPQNENVPDGFESYEF